MTLNTWGQITFDIGSVVTVTWLFWKRFEKRLIQQRVNARFIYDMATNHLPHIYAALAALAKKLDVDIVAPPNINFYDLTRKD
jgi:hypothetical protein